jgi:hypothetical protein
MAGQRVSADSRSWRILVRNRWCIGQSVISFAEIRNIFRQTCSTIGLRRPKPMIHKIVIRPMRRSSLLERTKHGIGHSAIQFFSPACYDLALPRDHLCSSCTCFVARLSNPTSFSCLHTMLFRTLSHETYSPPSFAIMSEPSHRLTLPNSKKSSRLITATCGQSHSRNSSQSQPEEYMWERLHLSAPSDFSRPPALLKQIKSDPA